MSSPIHRAIFERGLRQAVTVLDREFGEPFTVEGVEGEFTGRLNEASIGTDLELEGVRPNASATLHFGIDVPWEPTEGKRVSAGGREWLTGEPARGIASWTVPLMAPDQ
jgi:hypothetical protein